MKDALDVLIDSLIAERVWQLLIERLEKAEDAKPESRCADSPKPRDRQTWFDKNKERKGAAWSSAHGGLDPMWAYVNPRYRPKVAPEPPLPPTVVEAVVDGTVFRLYYSFRSTTGPHLCRKNGGDAKETAKVEPK